MYVTISLSLYNVYSSLLYFILHSPLSFVGPKTALKIFLSKTPKIASSDFGNTHVSELYASTGLIKVLYNFILFYFIFWIYCSVCHLFKPADPARPAVSVTLFHPSKQVSG